MGDLSVVLRMAIGATLLVAAAGKLIGPAPREELVLVVPEVLVGFSLVTNAFLGASAVGALLLTTGFFVYALRPNAAPCSCFGARLPTTSRLGQRARNSALMFGSGALVALTFLIRPTEATEGWLDYSLGVIIAISLVGLPWVADKSLSAD